MGTESGRSMRGTSSATSITWKGTEGPGDETQSNEFKKYSISCNVNGKTEGKAGETIAVKEGRNGAGRRFS